MYGSKNILFMLPLIEKQKSHKLPNFSYPVSKKVLTSAKIMISGKKCSHHLMQASLKYLCAQFCYDWTEIKEMDKERGQSNGPLSPNLFNLQKKPNSCSVNEADRCKPCGGNSSSCQLCGSDKNTSIFESKYCNQVYQTKENFKYNSKMVVYLIGCRVFRNHNGSTATKFRARANNYKRTYRNFSKEQILSNQVRNQKLFREHICTMTLTGFVIRRS